MILNKWIFLTVLLYSGLLSASELVPDCFYLTTDTIRDTWSGILTRISSGVFDEKFVLGSPGSNNIPLTLIETYSHSSNKTDPGELANFLHLKLPLHSVMMSIGAGMSISQSRNKNRETNSTWIGTKDNSNVTLETHTVQTNHTRIHYSGIYNVRFTHPGYITTLMCGGQIIQDWGYSYESHLTDNHSLSCNIQEYEPSDLSYAWQLGFLISRYVPDRRNPYFSFSGFRYQFIDDHKPLRGPAFAINQPIQSPEVIKLHHFGERTKKQIISLWCGIQPVSPHDSTKNQGHKSGRFVMREAIAGIEWNLSKRTNAHRYDTYFSSPINYFQSRPLEIRYLEFGSRNFSVTLKPEFFLTRSISFLLPLETDIRNRGIDRENQTYIQCTMGGSFCMRFSLPWNLLLHTTIHSGEFVFDYGYPEDQMKPLRYRQYAWAIEVDLLGLRR
jgi:hypothetical protein